jgi:hypothetical protein
MPAPVAIPQAAPVIHSTAWPPPLTQARTTAELRSVTKRYEKAIALEHFLYICRPPMQCLNHSEAFSGVI